VRLILRLSSSRPRPLAAVPALLRLVVVPCLNAHKRPVRDPPPFSITLLRRAGLAHDPPQLGHRLVVRDDLRWKARILGHENERLPFWVGVE